MICKEIVENMAARKSLFKNEKEKACVFAPIFEGNDLCKWLAAVFFSQCLQHNADYVTFKTNDYNMFYNYQRCAVNTSEILSLLAIVISILGFIVGHNIDHFLYGPTCRVAAFSVSRGLEIVLENVGNRVMHVKRVTYTIDSNKKNKSSYQENLSSFFYKIPCETRSESRPTNEDLFPNSKHKLINTTFYTQNDLIKAWKIVGNITVKVEYRGPIKKFFPTYIPLKVSCIAFLDAMNNGKGGVRKLKAFKEIKKVNVSMKNHNKTKKYRAVCTQRKINFVNKKKL